MRAIDPEAMTDAADLALISIGRGGLKGNEMNSEAGR
jgi:hypothetical protein